MIENTEPSSNDPTHLNRRARTRNGPRPYSRTGLSAVKAKVQVKGLSALDMRTLAARGLVTFRENLTRDVGGDLSTQQREYVEMATRTKLYLDHVDHWLMGQPTLINKKRRCLLPVLKERTQLADALARYLASVARGEAPPTYETTGCGVP